MTKFSKILRNGFLAALLIGISAAGDTAFAKAPDPAQPAQSCFYFTQWHGWKAPTPSTIYLNVNNRDVYRADLSGDSYLLRAPYAHLISQIRGSDTICSGLDLDLAVSTGDGFREPLIVKSLTKLTPAEVAAIPPKYRP